jgi:hypothetical protein
MSKDPSAPSAPNSDFLQNAESAVLHRSALSAPSFVD